MDYPLTSVPRPDSLQYNKMCTCSVHCTNHCEVGHCGPNPPWCLCWCHAGEYSQAIRRITKRVTDLLPCIK